jgi:hypothetical protein
MLDTDRFLGCTTIWTPPAVTFRPIKSLELIPQSSFARLMLLVARRRLKSREVAHHEEQVQKPEGEPDRCDDRKPNQEQDQTWRQEHRGVTHQPETIRSPGLQRPFGVTHPSAKRTPVVVQRREHEREASDTHRNQCGLKQHGIDPAALKPWVQKEQHEGEDRDVRPGERIRPGDVDCCKIFSHQIPPF